VSKETRKDFVLLAITPIAAAIGMRSVFPASRPLAWIAIVISDSYLSLVLLFAAILSDDRAFAARWPWITGLFPRRTTALFVVTLLLLSIVSGFAGLYVGTEVFPSSKTPGDALYISLFTLALPITVPSLVSFSDCRHSSAYFTHRYFRKSMNASSR